MSELLRTMTDRERLLHRLNMNGGDASQPLRALIGEAHDEILRLTEYAGELIRLLRSARAGLVPIPRILNMNGEEDARAALEELIDGIDAALDKGAALERNRHESRTDTRPAGRWLHG